jgi:hypothetical protein
MRTIDSASQFPPEINLPSIIRSPGFADDVGAGRDGVEACSTALEQREPGAMTFVIHIGSLCHSIFFADLSTRALISDNVQRGPRLSHA